MISRAVLTAVMAGAMAMPAVASAATVPAAPQWGAERYLYMVRDVSYDGDIYTGRFTLMRKSGRWVTGAYGMFYSEARCLTGRVKGYSPQRWLVGSLPGFWYGDEWIPQQRLSAKWVGYGSAQRMRGWIPVDADEMYMMSGGGVDASLIDTVCSAS